MRHFITILLLLIVSNLIYSQSGWYQLNSGTQYNLRSIYFTDTLHGCAAGEYGVLIITSDGGASWQGSSQSVDFTFNSVWFPRALTGYAVGIDYNISNTNAILFGTSDGGLTWGGWGFNFQDEDSYLNSVNFVDANSGFAVGYLIDYVTTQISPLVMRSTDGGANWTDSSPEITTILRSVFCTDGQTAYSVGSSGKIIKTDNGGLLWFPQTSGLITAFNTVYFVSPDTGYVAGDYEKLLKTTNGGTNWVNISGSLSPYITKSIFFLPENHSIGFTSLTTGKIKRTTDAGASWNSQVSGTQENLNCIYMIDSLNGFICGNHGIILKTTTGGLVPVKHDIRNVPQNYALKQNYPNPFNPSTVIEFDIPHASNVTLKVYDMVGREVATLLNENMIAGKYTTTWDAGNFSSGTYFCRITAGDFIDTKKMVLVK